MDKVKLGSTGYSANKNAFGVLPLQRAPKDEAVRLLNLAYDAGFEYYDTARFYTDSEEKIGLALSDKRDKVIIATKTRGETPAAFWSELETSLKTLRTDYIDVYQFHNPTRCPRLDDGTGVYEAMLEAKEQGKIRHIGLTNHRLPVAMEAAESGLYEIIQFPFSYLATKEEHELVELCERQRIGFTAMKALSGGIITSGTVAFAYLAQFPSVLPLWGIQRENELLEFIECGKNPPVLDAAMEAIIEKDRQELSGNFCRACGYCLPCPANIEIPNAARMARLLRRSPLANYLSPQWQENMKQIENCIECNHCKDNCPYGLDTPALLKANYEDYKAFIQERKASGTV